VGGGSGHEGLGAAIVAGVNAWPVLETAEHILDFTALPIERLIVVDDDLPVSL
jgi:hypothetical protein